MDPAGVVLGLMVFGVLIGLISGGFSHNEDDTEWKPNKGAIKHPTKREFDELISRVPGDEFYDPLHKLTCDRCGSTNVTRKRRVEKEVFGKATKTYYTCKYCNYVKITSQKHSFWGPGRYGR